MPSSILVIDDDPALREHIGVVLALSGYQVRAVTAPVALALAAWTRPDLILLDLDMPLLDGAAVRASLLAEPATAGVPVIVMADPMCLAREAPRLCVQGMLAKPLQYEEVIAEIARQLGEQSSTAGSILDQAVSPPFRRRVELLSCPPRDHRRASAYRYPVLARLAESVESA